MRIAATFVSVLIAGTLSFTIAQEKIPSTDQLLKSVPSPSSIPGLENVNLSSIKTEDIEKVAKERCAKNGGPEAYSVAKNSIVSFSQCLQSLVNVIELQTEMDEARSHGELNEVFKKYCRKVPNLKRCVGSLIDDIEPCLESDERGSIKIVHKIINSLLEFICHDEGDRLAMFITTGGIECLKAKQQAVAICASETFASYVQRPAGGAVSRLSSIPMLVLDLEQCRDIESFKTCTVGVFEECTDPSLADFVESFFNFVKKVTPCKALLEKPTDNTTGNSGFGSQPASRLPVSTSNRSIGHTESSTSSVTPASQESVPHEKEHQSVKTTPSQADTRPNSFAGSGRQTSFENSWSKTSSPEPDNQYLPLAGGKCENERMREKYEKTKLELLELETNNKRDTGIQNSQLHELAMEKLTLEIERLKEARKYEQKLYELQIKKIRLEIHAQELKTQVEA